MLSALSLFGADHPAGPGKPAIGGCQLTSSSSVNATQNKQRAARRGLPAAR